VRKGAAVLIVIVVVVPVVAARCHCHHPQLMFIFVVPLFSCSTSSLVHLPFDTGLLPIIVVLHLSLGAESLCF